MRLSVVLVVLLVIATVDDDLAANFTGGKVHGVKVHIARSLVDGAQSAGEVSGGNPLCRGAGNVRRSDGAREGSRSRCRARWLAAAAAQPDHDATCDVDFAKVDVRQDRVPREVLERLCK